MSLGFFSVFRKDRRYVQVFLSLAIFLSAYAITSFRIDHAPDIFTDEIIYSRVGIRVAGEGALVWDSGEPFLVHPPLYFLAAGLFEVLSGKADQALYSPGDIFSAVFHFRLMNNFFGAMTCVVLFWFGKRLQGNTLGFLAVGMFLLDPFALRINRRAMLETLAMLLSLSALFIFWNSIRQKYTLKSSVPIPIETILAGLLFGAALLTKELTFIFLLPLVIFSTLEVIILLQQAKLAKYEMYSVVSTSNKLISILWLPIQVFIVLAITVLSYSMYLIWIMATGNVSVYMDEKLLGIKRLLGLVQITGWNRPGISLFDILGDRLIHYSTSYLILALGGVALISLLVWGQKQVAGRYLIALGIVLYPFFSFIALFGSGNDQFFYFLLAPAILILGYAIVFLSYTYIPQRIRIIGDRSSIRTAAVIITGILMLFISLNIIFWINNYGRGNDNGYTQFSEYIKANLPKSIPINASGDPIKFRYFLPGHPIIAAPTPEEAVLQGVHYFALAPKDVLMRYGRIQPELADWIVTQGTLLFTTSGNSYGDIYLYRVDYITQAEQASISGSNHQLQGSQFQSAKGSQVSLLIFMLLAWWVFGVGIFIGLIWLSRQSFLTKLNTRHANRF